MIYTKNLGKKLVFYIPLGVTYFTFNKLLKNSALYCACEWLAFIDFLKKRKGKKKEMEK